MLSFNDYIIKRLSVIAFLLLIFQLPEAFCQGKILDSTFTFRTGVVKTGNALNIITRQTGYYFTYDSKLIDVERKTKMSFHKEKLSTILNSLLNNDSLEYSIIDKYIIIYRRIPTTVFQDSVQVWDIKYITGSITDMITNEPLPFAAIGIKSKGRGTVTNNNGEFGLKITPDCINDSLTVSYLGFYSREISIRQALGNNLNIKMMRKYIPIPEIIIRNQAPQEILRRSYTAIPHNYGNSSAYLIGFYREAVIKKAELQVYSEAILHVFKSPYSGTILRDQIKVLKSRKIENTDLKDTLTVRLKGGLSSCLELDGVKNTFDFLVPENFPLYSYRMTDIVTVDDESAFVIEFVQKPGSDDPLFKGTLYINTSDYAIMQAEFELNPEYIHKSKQNFITYQAKNYRIWPVTVRYIVSYRKIDNRYFLNHVRGDIDFMAKQKKKLFNTQFNVFFEFAVTDVNLQNVTRFDREELAPIHSIFSKTINNYDALFWGNQDFLKPEENLLQALKNMKVRLQEFSK
jgi:hypothetical protein